MQVEISNNEEVIYIPCPYCKNWEQQPIDQQRRHLQTFDILRWAEDQKDKPEESVMNCHSCKNEFTLIWAYDKNPILL